MVQKGSLSMQPNTSISLIWEEFMDFTYQEIICWRMYGIDVTVEDDWILVDVKSQFKQKEKR